MLGLSLGIERLSVRGVLDQVRHVAHGIPVVEPVKPQFRGNARHERGAVLHEDSAAVVVAPVRAALGDRGEEIEVAMPVVRTPAHLRHQRIGFAIRRVLNRGPQPVRPHGDEHVLERRPERHHHRHARRIGHRQRALRIGQQPEGAVAGLDAPGLSVPVAGGQHRRPDQGAHQLVGIRRRCAGDGPRLERRGGARRAAREREVGPERGVRGCATDHDQERAAIERSGRASPGG